MGHKKFFLSKIFYPKQRRRLNPKIRNLCQHDTILNLIILVRRKRSYGEQAGYNSDGDYSKQPYDDYRNSGGSSESSEEKSNDEGKRTNCVYYFQS